MDKSSVMVWGGVILAVVIGIGQESEQSWKLRPNGNSDSVQFTIHRFKPGSTWTWSAEVPLSRFRNLSANTLEHGGRAEFDYVTDAGKLHCKGSFSWHSGAGSFAFVANPDFAAELRNLGYSSPSQEQAFDMLMSDVSLEYARAVRDAGLHASTSQLLELRHHGVNAEYLRDLKTDGYDFTAFDVVELRNHGVGSDFLRDLKSLGLHPRASDMVEFRNHGISADYLGDLKAAGYGELNADQIVALRDHGVPADFAQQARELGYKFTPQELIDLRNHGVSAEYLKTLKESGIRSLTAEQIQKLRMHGVD